jgi:mono/diheme cytochrome c family protein
MRRKILIVVGLFCVIARQPETARAVDPNPPAQRDVASEVRAVFAARCAVCHGADVAKPKGRFGYVLDLKRVAANPEMVIPSKPDESELWNLVRRDEMPPEDSPRGRLTASEKEIVRAWIAAGAPTIPSATADPQPDAQQAEEVAAKGVHVPFARRLLIWLGKFHLLVLHFPIALFAAAAARESWSMIRRSRVVAPEVRFCVRLGAMSAVSAAALGWLHALGGNGAAMPRVLALHRWLGTASGLWVLAAAVLSECDVRRGERSWAGRVLLLGGALLIGLTGHLGGTLAQGVDFFDW